MCQAVGMSRWCLHLVAHGLRVSSANTVTLLSALLNVTARNTNSNYSKTFFGALQAAFQAKFESGDEFRGY